MEEKKYPIGGYAPGNYQCHCGTCGGGFIGDKRAYQCEPCAVRDREKFDALSPEEQTELMIRNAEAIREAFLPKEHSPKSEVWVKTSERLPGINVPARWKNHAGVELPNLKSLKELHTDLWALLEWEWLDESGQSKEGNKERKVDGENKALIDRIKAFNLSDVDAPVFTHTKEFEAHFSYIKGKLMDVITNQQNKNNAE